MKKITLLFIALATFNGFAQQKSTGLVTLSSNTSAILLLDNSNATATLTLSGPNDRWFALQFGSFANGDGMQSGEDIVYFNGTILVDAKHGGVGVTPSTDATNNWTLVSNNNNVPSTGLRTIIYSRPLNSGDSNDYVFNFADTSIDFSWARSASASYSFANHGGANRGYAIDRPLTVLGLEDFSLNASSIFPNPSNGAFLIKTKTTLEKINVYSQTGSLVKTIQVNDISENVEININGLQTGIYLLELVNATEKSWKKVIVE